MKKNKEDKQHTRKNFTRLVAAILAIMIAVVMVATLAVSAVRADESGDAASEGEGTEALSAESTEEEDAADEDGGSEDTASGDSSSRSLSDTASSDEDTSDSADSSDGTAIVSAGSGEDTLQDFSSGRIYICNLDVTGMSEAEADAALTNYMDKLSSDTIILYAGDKTYETTAGDLGLDYTNTTVVDEALSIGTKGNILKRFLADKQIEEDGPIVLDLVLSVDESKVRSVVEAAKEALDCEPEGNAMLLGDNGVFTVLPVEDGITVNVSESVTAVTEYMESEWYGGTGGVELSAAITEASDTSDQLKKVKNLLGTAYTEFSTDDEGRATNITLAAEHIDGTILYPGEEFSALDVIGPTTEENGFALGASYASGTIVQTYGGGVCQVTSTLYDAVLEAELEVTERHSHTMRVHYVLPAFDATMSDEDESNLVDFRFVNSTDAPIYIHSEVSDGTVTFCIYGEETRNSSRTIEYESRTISTSEYTDAYITSSDLEFGAIQQISGENGLKAELWKIIYIDGEYDSEEKVNTSNYNPTNHTYVVGIAGASTATANAIRNACGASSLSLINQAIANGTTAE